MATPDDSVVEYYYEDLEVSASGPGLVSTPRRLLIKGRPDIKNP
ncbi:hypothetical protein N9M16_00720 [Candidatus Dependentiae bacterium]|nr:hypothetical protein [Candidatus Dependentiae bacterium]